MITIYTTPTCKYCNQVKQFLKNRNLEYTEVDVAADPNKKAEMVEKSGQMGVPVTIINDKVIKGYDLTSLIQSTTPPKQYVAPQTVVGPADPQEDLICDSCQ